MSQTMLLTKRLTAFLAQNTTPQLPTLLLLSPTGKLLSSSSPLPASTLRTQATIACSLWNLYQPTTSIMPSALPSQSHSQSQSQTTQSQAQSQSRGSDATFSSTSTITDHDLSTITIQLAHGIMVIRALSCGLLFVAMGPSTPSSQNNSNPNSNTNHHQPSLQAQAHMNLSRHTTPPSSPQGDTKDGERGGGAGGGHLAAGMGSAAPSDAGSIRSTGTRTGSIVGIKRQAVEIGKWLDGQLEGFRLSSPDGR
ncbi:hypothetical protein IFR04_006266 [Cadophora malorum]|uniref:Roadblock/LAMTOR2 domain-containing protein n=1 Tax=Cadophora malorum TaxID=108018 RepID=A0A8H7TFC8_9HELO|nr:hypothetical protein IFR04_006266 [Cadophora malorum]